MNKRGAGVSFCFMATILFSIRYIISAVIFITGEFSFKSELFNENLGCIDNTLIILSVISLGVGIFYLIMAEGEK